LVNCLLQVHDLAISQNKQNVILLVILALLHLFAFDIVVDLVKHRREPSGPEQRVALERCLVSRDAVVDAHDFWVEYVAVESKAMHHLGGISFCASKAVERKLLVSVVVLQNTANCLHSSDVLVPLSIPKVQRIRLHWISIAQSEVDCDLQSNLAASEDVVQERLSLFYFNLSYRHREFATVYLHSVQELAKSRCEGCDSLVVSTLVVLEHLEHYFF